MSSYCSRPKIGPSQMDRFSDGLQGRIQDKIEGGAKIILPMKPHPLYIITLTLLLSREIQWIVVSLSGTAELKHHCCSMLTITSSAKTFMINDCHWSQNH